MTFEGFKTIKNVPTGDWRETVYVIRELWSGQVIALIKENVVGCEDCGRPYGDEHGFPDLLVPHDIWEKLMPGRNGGGLLCPSCMCKRAYDLGLRVEARFTSGPFRDHSYLVCKMMEQK